MNNWGMTSLSAVKLIPSPIGDIAIGCTEKGLATVEILTDGMHRMEFSNSQFAQAHCEQAATEITGYFATNKDPGKLPLDVQGTEFQVAVWQEISRTPFGKKVSYGEIAAKIGKPRASRAVGAAVGANPVPLVVGCHRVLGSQNRITGYSGGEGIATKIWLLEHEGIEFLN